ncbi:MAG: tyrosine-type recombinase/integrase, partial [Acidobacteriaceae bacterium]
REAPTVKELSDLYMADDEIQKKSSNTKRNEKQMLDSIIIPSLGTRKAGSITRQDISKLHASLKATPYRANRVAALLSTMFSFAKEQRICQENPVKGVKKYHEEKRNRWLTPEEMSSLANAISNYPDQNAADCIRLLMLTGAREGEALNATWKEFDIEHGVWVKPSHHTKQKKTEYVTLSDAAIALLKRMAERKTGNFLFPGAEDENGEIKRARITIRRPWTQICKAAGLTEEVIKEGKRRMANGEKRKLVRHKPTVRIHDLRHNFASYLVSSGVSLPIIGRLLGHTQPQTTARYAHLQNDPLREAANKFPRLI